MYFLVRGAPLSVPDLVYQRNALIVSYLCPKFLVSSLYFSDILLTNVVQMNIAYTVKFVSPEIGYGLFSLQKVEIGQVIYSRTCDATHVLLTDETLEGAFNNLPLNARSYFLRVCTPISPTTCMDVSKSPMRFMNHSPTPNSRMNENGDSICIRRISPGEEIVEDYRAYPTMAAYELLYQSYFSETLSSTLKKFK